MALLIYPRLIWSEQEPGRYREAFVILTGLSFSSQMLSALLIDGQRNALGVSIIRADLRSIRQTEEFSRWIGAEMVYELTGHRLSPLYSTAKIM